MTRLASLHVMIHYSQLILYLPSMERPGHLWENEELDQGFAWSPGIVSLGVPEHVIACVVEMETVSDFKMPADAFSCVRAPFHVSENPVYVGSVYHYHPVNIPYGSYSLYCETL